MKHFFKDSKKRPGYVTIIRSTQRAMRMRQLVGKCSWADQPAAGSACSRAERI